MTQRVFDIENEKDMADLWGILPDTACTIKRNVMGCQCWGKNKKRDGGYYNLECITINWRDKAEITRPIQEATEQDVGKLCYFWNDDDNFYGKLDCVLSGRGVRYSLGNGQAFRHCRRLTKQEIEELC